MKLKGASGLKLWGILACVSIGGWVSYQHWHTEQLTQLLHVAAERGDTVAINKLLSYGVSVDARDDLGWTPLVDAACAGRASTIDYLLSRGARVNAKTNVRETALMWAVKYDHTDAARLLLAKGANVNASDINGTTPLMWCAQYPDMVKLLLSHGADADARNYANTTARGMASSQSAMLLQAAERKQ